MRGYLRQSVLLLALCVALSAQAKEIQLTDNLFLVKDEPGTPLYFQMLVHAGCSDEADADCRGLAHYLEHLILAGRNPEHRDAAIRLFENGYSNGFTNQRVTGYVHSTPANQRELKTELEKFFRFYAARLENFSISQDEAARERNVVLQEHDLKIEAYPFRKFLREIDRQLLPNHVAGEWSVGTRQEIESLTLEEARTFHRQWYAPNNITFIIKGNVDAAELKEIARRALEGKKARPLPPRQFDRPIAVTPGRKDLHSTDQKVRDPVVIFNKLVQIKETDPLKHRAAMTLLSQYLTSHLPGSLVSTLIYKKQLAADRPFIELKSLGSGKFWIAVYAQCGDGVKPELLLHEVTEFVDGLSDKTVKPDVFERLKSRIAGGWDEESKNADLVYARLSRWFAMDYSYADYLHWPASIADLSGNDVGQIAAAFGGTGRIVSGILEPVSEETSK
jgi:zinc protease